MTHPSPASLHDHRAAGGWINLLLIAAFASLLVPPLAVAVPPVLDYPNHYARLWLIAGGAQSPQLARFYEIDWSRAGVNIGGDLLVAGVGPLLGKAFAPKLLLAISIVLPPAAALMLHRRLFRRPHPWDVAFLIPAWGMTALVGFMNFQLGVGLALLAAAADDAVARRGLAVALPARAAAAGAVLLFHPFAAVFYVGLVGALAAGGDSASYRSWTPLKAKLAPVARAAAPPAALVFAVMAVVPNPVQPGPQAVIWPAHDLPTLASILTTGIQSYSGWGDKLAALAVLGLVGLAALRRRLGFHAGLLLLALALAGISLLMPSRIGMTAWVERRLPVMALLAFLVAVRPDLAARRPAAAIVASTLLLIGLMRTAAVGSAWTAAQDDIAALRRALAPLPAGALLLTVVSEPAVASGSPANAPEGRYYDWVANYWNYPALAVPWRQAYVPNLFTQVGQQPLKVREPWTAISAPFGKPPSLRELRTQHLAEAGYARSWRACFDYVLILNADLPDGEDVARLGLREVSDQGFAVLYQNPEASPGGCHRAWRIAERPAAGKQAALAVSLAAAP